MTKNKRIPRYPNKYLILGVLVTIIGLFALLWTLGILPSFNAIWPFPFILVGLVLLYIVYIRGKSSIYIIFGMITFLLGIFFLIMITLPWEQSLVKIWPGFMSIAGISLLPYAYRLKRRKAQIGVVIGGGALIVLSFFFFLFSLGIIGTSLSDFISHWWPIFILVIGGSLIVAYLFAGKSKKPNEK
jgi:hypothetical protein